MLLSNRVCVYCPLYYSVVPNLHDWNSLYLCWLWQWKHVVALASVSVQDPQFMICITYMCIYLIYLLLLPVSMYLMLWAFLYVCLSWLNCLHIYICKISFIIVAMYILFLVKTVCFKLLVSFRCCYKGCLFINLVSSI